MTHSTSPSLSRCLAVWGVVTGLALLTWSTVAGTAASLASAPVRLGPFEDLLVAVASTALLVCATHLWVITTATVTDLARGVVHPAPRGLTRRLVLAACGAVVLAGLGAPALADSDVPAEPTLTGLPMPDRAAAPVRLRPVHPLAALPTSVRRSAPAVATGRAGITVQPGDSLWSIAAARLPRRASAAEIDAAWRALYAANRPAIGSDPDLIHPGLTITPDQIRKARP